MNSVNVIHDNIISIRRELRQLYTLRLRCSWGHHNNKVGICYDAYLFLDFQAPSYEINVFNPNATNSLNVESLLKSRCSTPWVSKQSQPPPPRIFFEHPSIYTSGTFSIPEEHIYVWFACHASRKTLVAVSTINDPREMTRKSATVWRMHNLDCDLRNTTNQSGCYHAI